VGTPAPEAGRRLVDHIDLGRKVFLSGDYKDEHLPKTKTPHEQGFIQRQIAAIDKRLTHLCISCTI